MTEISKNSRNQRADTVSNTGGNSGNVPPYPYTGQPSQSPQRESAYNSFNINGYNQDHIDSPEDNFDVAIKDILPLISSIKEENEFFKHEKKVLEAQMKNLHNLSQNLLSQNQQLRKHHSMRTHDIKKIIDTISINTNQQINDINHQSFLVKQSNHLIVKKIQQKIRSDAQINAKLQQQKKQLQRITLININLKQNKRDLQVKNKQLFYKSQQLKNQVKNDDANKDLDEINDLTAQITALKCQNKAKLLQARSLINSHRQERPKFQQNHQHIIDQVKELQVQAKGYRETAKSSEQKLQQAQNTFQQASAKFTQSLRLYEHLKFQQLQKRQQISKLKASIQQRNKKQKSLQPQLQKAKRQKQNLIELIRVKKQGLKKGEERLRQQKLKSQLLIKQESTKMKQTLNKVVAKANEQIQSKIIPQSQRAQQAINNNREQYAILVQQIEQLEQNVKKLENPIKEIIRLQYLIKKGK